MCRILVLFLHIFLLTSDYIEDVRAGCSRIPQGASGERSAVDDNFKILIDGNPETYIPDHQYNVSLSCPINMKFISFTLTVESEEQPIAYSGQDMTGHFELFDKAETRFSVGCENMIESTNTNAKTRIEVSWLAPKQPDSGCVLIKAGVVQHRDVWFIDDGFLTKRLCPEEIDELNSHTPTLQSCCACDEAKYEIVLERKWARNTHAKHFPVEAWRTRIGEVIGASHSYGYRYWAYGGRASQGMQELAEHGATRTLEQEIRQNTQNGEVRTIIKAPGIGYRLNAYGTTLANARVDPRHHQISLAAKVDPSPDWILGVAGLELCLSNCTWLERKVLNLYPWDVGTDAGPSYMSPDQPQVPPDVIRRISSTYPSDYRSPFFDDRGTPMKPLATLYLTRKKLYIRECEEVPQDGPLECATHPWNDWTNCSTRCGPGYSQRQRSYKNPMLAASYNCDLNLNEIRQCQGTQCGAEEELSNQESDPNGPESTAECELTAWSDWSPCSKTCGRGISTRTRDFHNPQARYQCRAAIRLPLEESKQCIGSDCGGTIPDNGELDGFPDAFGEINQGGYDRGRAGWGVNRAGADMNRQDNNNLLAGESPAEIPRRYDANELERSNDKLVGNRLNLNDYKQDYRPSSGGSYNDYRQDNRQENRPSSNYNDYRPGSSTYNDYRQNTRGEEERPASNYNDYRTNSDYDPSNNGLSTRAPFARNPYADRQPDTGNNYNVVQDYCYEKPYASTQPCLANPVVQRNFWFYDHDDHECKIFTTDNCDQNSNRFRTLMACEGTCLLPQMNLVRTDDGASNYGNTMYPNSQSSFAEGFGEPMSQTRNIYNNARRYGRNGK